MIVCKELDGTLQRTICVTIRPTPTELADAIWNLSTNEQITLLGCLKRRFCNSTAGAMQMADVANKLSKVSNEKSSEVKSFVRDLADFILGGIENESKNTFTIT